MINSNHRFLPGIAAILASLQSQSSGKGQHIGWFDNVKEVLSKTVLLHHPQTNAPTSFTVDGSNIAIGVQLEQRQCQSCVHVPFAFFLRKLSESERKYSAFDCRLLAFYGANRHCRHFLERRRFTLYTNHKPLKSALKAKLIVLHARPDICLSMQSLPRTSNISKANSTWWQMLCLELMQFCSCTEDVVGNVD